MSQKVERKFDPEWDLVYLLNKNDYQYAVIQKPEPYPGEDYDKVYVEKGCFVYADGRWFFWRLLKPMEYEQWKNTGDPILSGHWVDINDHPSYTPDWVFANRINQGSGTVGHPAPKFTFRDDNNWRGFQNPPYNKVFEVLDHISTEMLGDLILGPMLLAEYLRDGVEDPKKSKKVA